MSRANPTEVIKNPVTKWFEWKSKDKCFVFYSKAEKELFEIPLPFTFIFIDRTATVRGYNKKQGSGIYSNEVKSTKEEVLHVRYFEGGPIASGLWDDIKDRVNGVKGKFGLNIYLAYRGEGGKLMIGAIQATGCCLSAWIEFEKQVGKKTLEEKAVQVRTYRSDVTGDVEFNAPVFTLKDCDPKTNAEAILLEKQVQEYFKSYFERASSQPAAKPKSSAGSEPESQQDGPPDDHGNPPDDGGDAPIEDDVPF